MNRTPEHFTSDIKLFRTLTLHQTPLKVLPAKLRDEAEPVANKAGNVYFGDLPEDVREDLWRMFLEGLEPLRSAGKLG